MSRVHVCEQCGETFTSKKVRRRFCSNRCMGLGRRGAANHNYAGGPHPLYNVWKGMLRRCTDPRSDNYQYYGARGITVCERWTQSLEAFAADVGPRPSGSSLDRIDVNGPYSPENVRWATAKEQAQNRRPRAPRERCLRGSHELTPDNVRVNGRGERQCKECQKHREFIRRHPIPDWLAA